MSSKEEKNSYTKKILAVLKLPEDQMELAMDYIYGAVEDETLEKFDYKDLSFLTDKEAAYTAHKMKILALHNDVDEVRRLINVLFAIGQGTCSEMLRYVALHPQLCERFFSAESEEMLYKYYVIFANVMALEEYHRSFDMCDFQKPDTELACMRRAMDCPTITDYGRGCLQAMYLKKKYIDKYVDSLADAWGNSGKIRMDKGDYPLLEAYENIMINSLGEILNNISASALKDIQKAVRSDDVDKIYPLIRKYNWEYEEMLLIRGYSFEESSLPPIAYRILKIGGLAYMSILLSPVFNNIVHLCFRVNSVLMLCIVDELSQGDADIFNGDFANHFGIDTRVFIRWLANRSSRYRNALQWQLQTNKDIYLEITEEEIAHFGEGYKYSEWTAIYLLEFLGGNDPDSYQSMLIDARKKYMEQCIENIASKYVEILCYPPYCGNEISELSDEEKLKLKAFLTGRESLDAIYPIATKVVEKNYNDRIEIIEEFRKIFGDCEFTLRYMIVAAFFSSKF